MLLHRINCDIYQNWNSIIFKRVIFNAFKLNIKAVSIGILYDICRIKMEENIVNFSVEN